LDNDLFPQAGMKRERPAEDFLGLAPGVDVGVVEENDARSNALERKASA